MDEIAFACGEKRFHQGVELSVRHAAAKVMTLLVRSGRRTVHSSRVWCRLSLDAPMLFRRGVFDPFAGCGGGGLISSTGLAAWGLTRVPGSASRRRQQASTFCQGQMVRRRRYRRRADRTSREGTANRVRRMVAVVVLASSTLWPARSASVVVRLPAIVSRAGQAAPR